MPFNYFNQDIAYRGQDLHMMRNNKIFPLYQFFDTSTFSASYKYRLKGDYNSINYDKIIVTSNGTIKAEPYANPSDAKIENFFVEVTINNQVAVILVHLHDRLKDIWASPSTLTLRKGMNAKFGILASFTDANYADFTFYPGIKQVRNVVDDVIILSNEEQQAEGETDEEWKKRLKDNRIRVNKEPSSYPHTIQNGVKLSLPDYLQNDSTEISIVGSIKVFEENGSLKLIAGNPSKIEERFNMLCLSDGFGADKIDKAKQSIFEGYVEQINSYMLDSNFLAPWNLLAGSKINIWSYYTKDEDQFCGNEGEFLLIEVNNTPVLRSLYFHIYNHDALFGSQIVDLTPTIKVKLINLSLLCSLVGLPSKRDLTSELVNSSNTGKKDLWKSLGWNKFRDGGILKFPGDSNISNGDRYLSENVFEAWKMLAGRIHLEKSDTTYGVVNIYLERSLESFIPRKNLEVSKYKFKNWMEYGKFISEIKSIEYSNFGKLFYNASGNAIYQRNPIGEKIIENLTYRFVMPTQANNVVILSRINLDGFKGINSSHTVTDETSRISAELKRSILCLQSREEKDNDYKYEIIDNKKYKLKDIPFNTDLNDETKNTFFHEFSHNYLLDEYNDGNIDFSSLDISDQQDETELTKFSNLQTKYDLQDPKPLRPNSGGNIKVDNIRWRWPRIKKIGIGLTINVSPGNMLSCTIQKPEEALKFEINTIVLIRKGSLFSNNYIRCCIDKIVNIDGNKQFITLTALEDFVNDISYKNNYFIIEPCWIDTGKTKYQELVHPITNKWIKDNQRALVEWSQYEEAQVIDPNLQASVFEGFDLMKMIGLFAGGTSNQPFSRNLYHSAGFCIMRNTKLDSEELIRDPVSGKEASVKNSFCQVCQYILVDFIDPTLHPLIDQPYGNSRSYPRIKKINN